MEEPWLRGAIAGMHPLIAPVLYAFQQAREDLARFTAGLTAPQIWARPFGLGSVGFHILHIAGSTDRLMTYLQGRGLSEAQLEALRVEQESPQLSREELLARMDQVFAAAESVIRSIEPGMLTEPRSVGRKQLLTTVIGLLTHIAEHTQRHVGQGISAARLAVSCATIPSQ